MLGIKRLLDVLLSGCLPVVIVFPTSLGSGRSWWRAEGPPVEWSLPFPWEIDWERLVVEVSEADFWQGRLAVYNSCDEEFDRSGGKSSTWLLLEHALARLYQVRDGKRVPDLLLLVVPSDSARLRSILEQFVERFASRTVLIFPTELLRRARAPDFEAATGLQMGSDPQDPLMLLMAILMDMGGVDVIHERLPYEPGSKDDPGLSDAVRAYESFQGIDHFSWDHLEGRVACLQHGGFFHLFDWKPPETLAELIVCIHGFGPALDVLPPGCRCSDTDAGFVK
ncbi:cya, partial [Symbiodinium necroappetens]